MPTLISNRVFRPIDNEKGIIGLILNSCLEYITKQNYNCMDSNRLEPWTFRVMVLMLYHVSYIGRYTVKEVQ